MDLSVIEGLQQRLRDRGRSTAEQGLLFGRAIRGAIEIFEHQPVSNLNVPETIAALPAGSQDRLLIGYYRTEHSDTLRLNKHDLFLFQTFFGKPYHVFLLIQPNAFAPPNATFFFSCGHRRITEFPLLEFPLDVSLLVTEEGDRIAMRRPTPTAATTVLKVAAGILASAFLLAAVSSTRRK